MFDCEKGIWDTEYLCKKEIYHKLREIANEYSSHFAVDKQSAVNRCSDIIMTMAAENVAPVSCGRWIKDDKTGKIYCSECGETAVFTAGYFYSCDRFCPHCGSKMNGE